jgi:chromate transport protein ChrA
MVCGCECECNPVECRYVSHTGFCTVQGAVCAVSGPAWPREHQNDLLHQRHPRWNATRHCFFLYLEASTRRIATAKPASRNLIPLRSLPAAIAAFGLALGISNVNQQLPDPVYALLSGLNAATVGIIVLAAVQLSQKAITDKISRILVFFGATAGMLYNTLWYFPVLMLAGGLSTIIWDYRWLQNLYRRIRPARRAEQTPDQDVEASESATELTHTTAAAQQTERRRQNASLHSGEDVTRGPVNGSGSVKSNHENAGVRENEQERVVPDALQMRIFSWKFGTAIIVAFFITFLVIMILRGVLPNRPRGFSLFANLYLAGTIIFGGGPVVIPLLRESVLKKRDLFPLHWLVLTKVLLQICCCRRLGLSPRLPPRSRHHPSLSRTKFQL